MSKEPNSPRVPTDRPLALTALACSKLILYCVTITATHTDLSDVAIAGRIGVYLSYLGRAKLLLLSHFRKSVGDC